MYELSKLAQQYIKRSTQYKQVKFTLKMQIPFNLRSSNVIFHTNTSERKTYYLNKQKSI